MIKKPSDFKYIAFDLDGTIMDTYEGVANGIRYALEAYSLPPADEAQIRLCIGPPLADSFQNLFGLSPEKAENCVKKFREFYAPIGQKQCRPYEGIEEVLKELKNMGKILFVATSKLIDPARSILENFGLAKYFHHIEGSPLSANDHSKADILNAALDFLGNPPREEVIIIGDTKFDIVGAKQVGIASMGVLYGFGSLEELQSHGADYIAPTTEDIIKSFK